MSELVKAAIAEAEAFGKQSKSDVPARVRLGRAAQASQQVSSALLNKVQQILVHDLLEVAVASLQRIPHPAFW